MLSGTFFTYRIRYILLAGVLLASIFFAIFVTEPEAIGQNAYTPKSSVMKQMIQSTNKLRLQNGLQPLVASESLENSAYLKLDDMKNNNYWGHYAPDGTSFSSFIWDEDSSARLVGENLARCFDSYDAAFDGLVQSPKHYGVLTGDFVYIGVASEYTANGCESIVMHVSS
jgi:uncharacterized protein YkwD